MCTLSGDEREALASLLTVSTWCVYGASYNTGEGPMLILSRLKLQRTTPSTVESIHSAYNWKTVLMGATPTQALTHHSLVVW
jgi:hypothetical protein